MMGDADNPKRGIPWKPIFAALSAIGITGLIVAFREPLRTLGDYGYAGVFLIALLGHATVLVPVPDLAVTFAMGGVLNPWIVGAVAGTGEGLGELTGYLAGYAVWEAVHNQALYARTEKWVKRYGARAIFVFAVVPNPLFDLAGMAAGALGMPWSRFFLACWAGKTVRSLVAALIGATLFGYGIWLGR